MGKIFERDSVCIVNTAKARQIDAETKPQSKLYGLTLNHANCFKGCMFCFRQKLPLSSIILNERLTNWKSSWSFQVGVEISIDRFHKYNCFFLLFVFITEIRIEIKVFYIIKLLNLNIDVDIFTFLNVPISLKKKSETK